MDTGYHVLTLDGVLRVQLNPDTYAFCWRHVYVGVALDHAAPLGLDNEANEENNVYPYQVIFDCGGKSRQSTHYNGLRRFCCKDRCQPLVVSESRNDDKGKWLNVFHVCLPSDSVDECASGLHDCHEHAVCTDLPYKLYTVNALPFSCQCRPGFRGNGTYCESECLSPRLC